MLTLPSLLPRSNGADPCTGPLVDDLDLVDRDLPFGRMGEGERDTRLPGPNTINGVVSDAAPLPADGVPANGGAGAPAVPVDPSDSSSV